MSITALALLTGALVFACVMIALGGKGAWSLATMGSVICGAMAVFTIEMIGVASFTVALVVAIVYVAVMAVVAVVCKRSGEFRP